MAGEGVYVCEQCGARQNRASYDRVCVFGQTFYFCSHLCRDYWLDQRKGPFEKPEAAEGGS